ncbi:prolactin regulatory element-binding protein isoform X5 [Hypomesus transpacificus]|uniref:prolactin regulatory element-binding protein isoform X5 n=1 Tax=Hypomesus transpacificus TaxID=137520 RepID=UPI001F07CF0B|nr:prolactin regulatory element-binding protein isoform X5 [Hypomesus transpacificus]
MGRRKVPDLYRAPFPLYTVKVDPTTGLVITAGGGGASKTGIKNALHFLGLGMSGGQFTATLLHTHDTETRATMNMALGGDVIAAGQDGSCCLMRFRRKEEKEGRKAAATEGGSSERGGTRRRAGRGAREGAAGGDTKEDTPQICVEGVGEVQSDLNPQDPLQKVVRFSPDLSLLLVGGTDGHIRVWEYPSLKEKYDFKAHKGEVEDLDISEDNKHLVTVGRDMACSLWCGTQLNMSLDWSRALPQVAERTYRYQACRFGRVEDQEEARRLYTVQIPHKRDRKPPPCYLTKWDASNFLPMLVAPCGTEVISCLAVSDSGTYLGLGTVTGSVAVYIAFSLQDCSKHDRSLRLDWN